MKFIVQLLSLPPPLQFVALHSHTNSVWERESSHFGRSLLPTIKVDKTMQNFWNQAAVHTLAQFPTYVRCSQSALRTSTAYNELLHIHTHQPSALALWRCYCLAARMSFDCSLCCRLYSSMLARFLLIRMPFSTANYVFVLVFFFNYLFFSCFLSFAHTK